MMASVNSNSYPQSSLGGTRPGRSLPGRNIPTCHTFERYEYVPHPLHHSPSNFRVNAGHVLGAPRRRVPETRHQQFPRDGLVLRVEARREVAETVGVGRRQAVAPRVRLPSLGLVLVHPGNRMLRLGLVLLGARSGSDNVTRKPQTERGIGGTLCGLVAGCTRPSSITTEEVTDGRRGWIESLPSLLFHTRNERLSSGGNTHVRRTDDREPMRIERFSIHSAGAMSILLTNREGTDT